MIMKLNLMKIICYNSTPETGVVNLHVFYHRFYLWLLLFHPPKRINKRVLNNYHLVPKFEIDVHSKKSSKI